ncbi:MAG: GTPase HflX, partial [Proteobacteria bacterium]|nr:GTPase HflX [Pseudomonadota bacterium]
LLLHVVDADDPLRDDRMAQVDAGLHDIGAGDIPELLVFNKIDRIEGALPRIDQREDQPAAVWLSARDRLGLGLLGEAVAARLGLRRIVAEVSLPGAAGRLRARLHALGAVRAETHADDGWHLKIDLAIADAARLAALPEGAPLRALLPDEDSMLPVELST